MAEIPPVKFATGNGARLAYQVWGEGPAVVGIPPMAQNIEMAWEELRVRAMFERLGSFCRYLHFDKRGTGSSDRRSVMPGMDERVDDLRTVMDDAGIERATLWGNSEGGPMTLLFAVTYPERVERLILSGTGATLIPPELTADERAERLGLMLMVADAWGTEQSLMPAVFAPSLAADAEFCTWHQRYERAAASSDSLRDLIELMLDMDVREVLDQITVPTLVLHRTDDGVIPVEFGRHLASTIPGAELFEEPGVDHFNYVGDIDGWLDAFERFVTGEVAPRPERHDKASVRISTLGRFAVEVDGEEVPTNAWGSRRARQLCKRLVAARGWPVTRDELIEVLWPDEGDRGRLSARLSVQLSTVRRILGGRIIADRETVRLDTDQVATDLDAFFGASDDTEIVGRYGGEFLPEDRYDDWSDAVRTEAHARFAAAARRLATRQLNATPEAVVGLANRILDADRYDQAAHHLAIAALARAGQLGRARKAHDAYAEAMAELDLDPVSFDTITTDPKVFRRVASHDAAMTNTNTTQTTIQPHLIRQDEGEHLHFLNHLATVKVRGDRCAVSVVEFNAERGFGPPLHNHDDEDELIVLLEGEVVFRSGNDEFVGTAGDCAMLPRAIPHTFQVLSDTARMLTVTASDHGEPQFDAMVRELGEPAPAPTQPEPAEIDGGQVAAVCGAHGISVLGPPPAPLG